MDWIALRAVMPSAPAMPDRYNRLTALEAVLDGRLYDDLPYSFSQEYNASGEYVRLAQRRPSVRTGLCRVAVDDAVSLLFSEGHWPAIKAASQTTTDALLQLVNERMLNETLLEAATRGSVGSIAIRFVCLKGKPFFEVMSTAALTPVWSADDPTILQGVTERYQVRGTELAAMGYQVQPLDMSAQFWFERTWDDQNETWYNPVSTLANGSAAIPLIDLQRTVNHGLGFVPIVWIKNLPSVRNLGCDGACSFEPAIDTVIEADYLLSQGGRALRYAADPKLVITRNASDLETNISGGASAALELPAGSDAKLLEINGNSAKAMIEHVQTLRGLALEQIHGNRTNADKLSAATSGRSIELMMSGLIWMADRLRISYGNGGLLSILRMVCAASSVLETGVVISGQAYHNLDPSGLELRWASWMPVMPQDLLTTAQALVTAVDGGVLSWQTAVQRFGSMLDVDDLTAELALVQTDRDMTAAAAQAAAQAAQEAREAAAAGVRLTHQATA